MCSAGSSVGIAWERVRHAELWAWTCWITVCGVGVSPGDLCTQSSAEVLEALEGSVTSPEFQGNMVTQLGWHPGSETSREMLSCNNALLSDGRHTLPSRSAHAPLPHCHLKGPTRIGHPCFAPETLDQLLRHNSDAFCLQTRWRKWNHQASSWGTIGSSGRAILLEASVPE